MSDKKETKPDSKKEIPINKKDGPDMFWVNLGLELEAQIKKYGLTPQKHYNNPQILHSIVMKTVIKPLINNKLMEE